MDTYKVKPLEEPMEVCVQVPGSKKYDKSCTIACGNGGGNDSVTRSSI